MAGSLELRVNVSEAWVRLGKGRNFAYGSSTPSKHRNCELVQATWDCAESARGRRHVDGLDAAYGGV